jgi:AcrR family transcriptional regulator
MATAAKRGPYAKTAERRKEILQVALDVFGRSGYRGSSVREIAERVGLSETGVLHHFGGKLALLEAVLAARDHADRDNLDLVNDSGPQPLRALVARNVERPGVVRLFATLSAEATDPDHPAHDFFRDRYARVRSVLAERLATTGAGIQPVVGAQLIAAVLDGLQTQWLLDEDVDMVAAFDAFIDLLLGTGPAAHCPSASPAPSPNPRPRKEPSS